jgi:hypothetical protein
MATKAARREAKLVELQAALTSVYTPGKPLRTRISFPGVRNCWLTFAPSFRWRAFTSFSTANAE